MNKASLLLLALLLTALSLVLAACSGTALTGNPATSSGSSSPTQVNEAGQVEMAITWQSIGGEPTFNVAMDTHSVDLDNYDLRELALLRTDRGEVLPTNWDSSKGGHHRGGTLSFPAIAPDGSPLIGPSTQKVELIIRGVAGVPERVFQWGL